MNLHFASLHISRIVEGTFGVLDKVFLILFDHRRLSQLENYKCCRPHALSEDFVQFSGQWVINQMQFIGIAMKRTCWNVSSCTHSLVTKTVDYMSSPLHRYFLSILASRQANTTQTSCITLHSASYRYPANMRVLYMHPTWEASRAAWCTKVNALRPYNQKKWNIIAPHAIFEMTRS